jgi:FKBP-type peptidyl-prolyl cis-trans isomerase SlyD
MTVQNGKVVSILFSLRKAGDKTLVASRMHKPFEFLYGQKKLILGLDKELLGLKIGEKKTIEIAPENGYGLREEKRILSLKRSQIPEGIKMHEGMTLKRKMKNGKLLKGVVMSFDSQHVVLDLNHPLAGEILKFKTEIVHIRDATIKEIES